MDEITNNINAGYEPVISPLDRDLSPNLNPPPIINPFRFPEVNISPRIVVTDDAATSLEDISYNNDPFPLLADTTPPSRDLSTQGTPNPIQTPTVSGGVLIEVAQSVPTRVPGWYDSFYKPANTNNASSSNSWNDIS